ncbi:S1 RNA-binding domain-containing protein [Chondromyces apiculatus]|uniref:S1 RNA binding domain protein n=1 Tax=Chondromyces apiculatus DSM 436 TaxID=1192034 RepID=A0A017SV24_9BACT|nr:S1 RNA-binding domain-containing protein [Chondromyces apiculatus]EYF00848.1 S1 RNA binding domain protein [Chondromyces apiculatus DSM 436]
MPQEPKESFASLFEHGAASARVSRRHQVGEQVEVTIVAVTREAIFADLGGKQEGMFERMDLATPDGAVQVAVGSRVSAQVAGFDRETGQARLKPLVVRASPEGAAPQKASGPVLVEGSHIKGKVVSIERFGVFVQIQGAPPRSGRGLVPTAETGTPRGADLRKSFTVGQDVEAKILSVDETGRIRLSFAALKTDAERKEFEAFSKGPKKEEKANPRSLGTLGDLLAKHTKR